MSEMALGIAYFIVLAFAFPAMLWNQIFPQ